MSKKSSVVQREMQEKFRLAEIEKRKKRNANIQQREKDERQRRFEKNMERLKKQENKS